MTPITRDQIMAEFGRFIEYPDGSDGKYVTTVSTLLFAEHVAALVFAAGQTAEREACAKTCEDYADSTSDYDVHRRVSAYWCADLIRKRGGNENIN